MSRNVTVSAALSASVAAALVVGAGAGCEKEAESQSRAPAQRQVEATPRKTTAPTTQAAPASEPAAAQAQPPVTESASAAVPEPAPAPAFTPAEQRRYNRVGVELVRAINLSDGASYRALFAPDRLEAQDLPWREMFADEIASRGRITRAFAFTEQGAGASMVVLLEHGGAARFTLVLDGQDRIVGGAALFDAAIVRDISESDTVIFDLYPQK